MLDFKSIRIPGTTLAQHIYDWLELNLVDWEEMSDGLRRKFFVQLEEQLVLSAESGELVQRAWLAYSYVRYYDCPIDLREYLIKET